MTRKLTTPILVTLFVLVMAAAAFPTPYAGYVSIDSVQAHRGDHFGVKVWLHNNSVAFSGLTVPIRYSSPYLSLDSVSYAGSILPDNFSGVDYNYAADRLVKITYIPPIGATTPPPTIDASDGVIAELYFTLSNQATAGFLELDSADIDSFIVNGSDTLANVWVGIVLSDNIGDSAYFPYCVPGGIQVLVPTDVNDNHGTDLPDHFALDQNYPNPFNPSTEIQFSVPVAGKVKLEVFNVLGQSVATLFDGVATAGVHSVRFDASSYPSGVYFYRLVHNDGTDTRKMVLLK